MGAQHICPWIRSLKPIRLKFSYCLRFSCTWGTFGIDGKTLTVINILRVIFVMLFKKYEFFFSLIIIIKIMDIFMVNENSGSFDFVWNDPICCCLDPILRL